MVADCLSAFFILSSDDGRGRVGNRGQVARGLRLGCQAYCGCNGQAKGRDAKCGESVPEPAPGHIGPRSSAERLDTPCVRSAVPRTAPSSLICRRCRAIGP